MSQIRSLLEKVKQMPHGSAKVQAAREVWNIAKQDNDASLRFEVLSETLNVAFFGGASDYFLALIPQFVQLKREHPEAIDPFIYVWRLKWLATEVVNYPEVPLERIRQAEAEYERELRNAGGNERTVLYMRWKNAVYMGRFESADQQMDHFLSMKRDRHADCIACEADALVTAALNQGDHVAAKKRATAILSGKLRCAEIPHLTLPPLALSTELNGEPEEASSYFQKGYRLIRSNIRYLGEVGLYIAFLSATGDVERGLRLLKTHVSWIDQNRTPFAHYHFLLGATAICQALADTRKRPLKLALPTKWLTMWGSEPLSLKELAQRFEQEGLALANAFDRRNENDWHTDNFRKKLALIYEHRESKLKAVDEKAPE